MAAKIDKIKEAEEAGKNTIRMAADILIEDYRSAISNMAKLGVRNEATYLYMSIKKMNQKLNTDLGE